jgi:vacuolar protein sorting-associated protein IST1
MSIQRIQIAKNKKAVASKHEKREIAALLGKNKEEMARIKVEHIIREVSYASLVMSRARF